MTTPLPPDPSHPSTARGRVWIVEDSALEAEMARRALAPTQDVELFRDGAVMLERLATAALPDAIVLDLQLPGIVGLDVCRSVRERHDQMELPILILTAQDRRQEVVDALRAGANDYVTKPYDVAELVARVGTLVRTSHLQSAQTRRQRQVALAAAVGAALTKGGTLDETALRCCEAIAAHASAASVEMWVRRPNGIAVVAKTHDGPPALALDDIERIVGSSVDWVAPRSSIVALPLVVRDEAVGVLGVIANGSVEETAAELSNIGDLLALGVARGRMEEERSGLLVRERNSRADAEAANRSKDEFLAMVSHELRTPLNAITGWVTMLLSGGLPADRTRRALETIERSARTQAQLIEDLLDISRIVSGNLRLEVSPVDVASITGLAVESVRLAAETKGVAISSSVAADVGHLSGDAERLQQVMWNLLSNAIKFTPKGGSVALDVLREGNDVHIVIRDTGQGIAPEFLPYVFDRFKQADGSMTRTKGGLGLGLAIVRHLVELHGGIIRASSGGAGKGATFEIVLPSHMRESHPPGSLTLSANTRASVERPREVEGMRVLVVDDEPDAREMLKELLESCNVTVETAASAAEAFATVRASKVDVVLSDIAMPDEDGYSLIRRIRQLPREEGGRIPAVALTAYARLDDRTRALRAGFNGHVAKPVEPSELLAVIASFAGP